MPAPERQEEDVGGHPPRSSGLMLLSVHPETIIAGARLMVATLATVAIYLDPTGPAALQRGSQITLGFYNGLALLLLLFPPRRHQRHPLHLAVHLVDAVVLGWLAYRSEELSSPFVATLPFIIFAMTFRWGLRGAIGAALILEADLAVLAWTDLRDGNAELGIFIMRSASYAVAALMIGYLGAYRERSRERLTWLADWPSTAGLAHQSAWLERLLRHAAKVLGTADMIVVWRDHESDRGSVACLATDGLHRIDVADAAFWARHDPAAPVASGEAARLVGMLGDLAALPFPRDRLRAGGVDAATFSGTRYGGRIMVAGSSRIADGGSAILQIVARRIGAELERTAMMDAMAESARSRERARLSRDLHDSVLQDLTAAKITLRLFADRLPQDDAAKLAEVSGLIGNQQRRIRQIVEDARVESPDATVLLGPGLRDRAAALQRQWTCVVRLVVEPPTLAVPALLAAELRQMLSEAVANAVRHGGADRIEVTAAAAAGALRLDIVDNGHGDDAPAGPATPGSLTDRARDLGGGLVVRRTAPGLGVHISLPLPAGAEA